MAAKEGTRFSWSPPSVKIAPGGSVTFTWGGGAVHDVSVPAIGFTSGSPTAQGSFTASFPAAGKYAVLCVIHPDMRGEVVVQ
jgi:plastocyanin